MDRTPVSSSSLRSVGYDSSTSTLEVEFSSGSVYQYYNVPQTVHSELMQAGSHGQYFDRFVKKAGYRYQQVR